MKKVLFILTLGKSDSGGSELLWSQAAVRFVERGVHVTVSVRDDKGPIAQHLQFIELRGVLIHIRDEIKKTLFGVGRKLILKFFKKQKDRFWWIKEKRPNLVVLAQIGNMNGLDFMEACVRFNIPYVVISQSASDAVWAQDDYLERVKVGFDRSLRCFFVSNANLALTEIQLGGGVLKNAEVVRNPFNVSYDSKPEWPLETVYKLLCLGRLEPFAKGQDVLFQVMSMKKWRDRPIQVVCIGKGPNARTLAQLARSLDLNNVEVRGFEENVEGLWRNFHALVLPSRHEGLPLVIVEAMLCGRICIVTDVAGNKELLEDGLTGFIAKAPTVELLDEAMERAWRRRFEWREMGRRAGVAVREFVPRDPANIFCDRLIELMGRD